MEYAISDRMRWRLRRESLQSSIDRLNQALSAQAPGHEKEWSRGLADALGRAEAVLRERLVATNESEGPLAEVDMCVPALARQAGDVCQAERDLLSDICALRAELGRVQQAFGAPEISRAGTQGLQKTPIDRVVDLNSLHDRTEHLVTVLQAINNVEIQLVQESANRDTGVGD